MNNLTGPAPDDLLRPLWTAALDPLFWPATRPGVESAWTAHIPFAHWLTVAHRPRCIVELGTHNGISYLAFCEAVQRAKLDCRCLAVDTWRGDPHAGFYDDEVYAALKRVHDQRFTGFSELLRTTFDDALHYVPDGSVDLLHIDGLHTYDAVRHDWAAWRPKLSRRAVVLFHDTNVREREFGVWRLFGELAETHPAFEFFHGHGLGLLAVGEECGPELCALTRLPDEAASTVRTRFAALGERWQSVMQAQLEAAAQSAMIRELDGQRAAAAHRAAALEAAQADAAARMAELEADAARVREGADLAASRAREEADSAASRAQEATRAAEARHVAQVTALSHALAAANERTERERRARLDAETAAQVAAEARATSEQARLQAEESAAGHFGLRRQAEDQARELHEDLDQARDEISRLARRQFELESALLSHQSSTAWRVTWPARQLAARLPRKLRRAARGAIHVGWWTLTLRLPQKLRQRRLVLQQLAAIADQPAPSEPTLLAAPEPPPPPISDELPSLPVPEMQIPPTHAETPTPVFDDLFMRRFPDLAALPVFAAPNAGARRLTVITDSINEGSLYGGVGTALILAALSAQRLGASLRLVARTEAPGPANVKDVLGVQGIEWAGSIDYLFAPRDGAGGGRDVPVAPGDLFLTTSWWTTWSTKQSIPRSQIAYLLQEDERSFYPYGDDHLRCAETLSDPDLLYIVNSHLLLGHLQANSLAPGAVAFEPAFPAYRPLIDGEVRTSRKRGFLFYARPFNARNLYWRGLEALCAAIEEGVLDPAEWDFHFAGHGAEPVALPGGAKPLLPGPMAWPEYVAFVRQMDLGLCLMYTPHPSYPPLDLAASGAVVVTNRFGPKQSLDAYSANILCADTDVDSLVAGLRRAKALRADGAAWSANLAGSGLCRDWRSSMSPAIERIATWAGG